MSRLILASLVALLGLSTGAAFATNDFLAQQAASQAAFLSSGHLAAEGGGGSSPPQGSTSASPKSSPSSSPSKQATGGNSQNMTKNPGGPAKQQTGGNSQNMTNNPGGPAKQQTGGNSQNMTKNPGGPAKQATGGDSQNMTNTTNSNTPAGGCSGGGGCDQGAQQATRDKEAAAQKAAERTRDYVRTLQEFNRDRTASPAEIKAAKEAAVSRLSQTPAAPTPRAPGMAAYQMGPRQGVNTYTTKISNIVGNPTTYDQNTTPEQRQQNVDTVSNQYNQNKAVQDAIEKANRGFDISGEEPSKNVVEAPDPVNNPEATETVTLGLKNALGLTVDMAAPPSTVQVETMYEKDVPGLTIDGKTFPALTKNPELAKPGAVPEKVVPSYSIKNPTTGLEQSVYRPATAAEIKQGFALTGKDPASVAGQGNLEGKTSVPAGTTEVNRNPPEVGRSEVDPTQAGKDFAAQKAAEGASKVAAAKAAENASKVAAGNGVNINNQSGESRGVPGYGQAPKGSQAQPPAQPTQPAKQQQPPAKQQQPSKVAQNPKTSPIGQGTGGEGGGGTGNQGRTQGTDGNGTGQQGNGQDGGTSPQGNGQGTNPNGQGNTPGGNTNTPGQGDSDSTGTDTQSPAGSAGQQGGVVGGQGTGNGTGDTDSQGTDTDGQDTGEGSGDVNGDDSDGNETGGGGGGTTQPKVNLTDRIAQLTQPKIGSFFARLFLNDEPSENVKVAPRMTEEEYQAGLETVGPLEGAFTAIGQPDEESETDEEPGEGGEEAEPPSDDDPRKYYRDNMAIGADDVLWDKVHPDLKRDKDRILEEGKIRTGALIAADAVYRHADKKGVPMHVAIEGGVDSHSSNHLKGGIGESLDIKPGTRDEHSGTWSKYKADPVEYAKIAVAAIQLNGGSVRIGVPLNRTNGLHVQDTGNEGLHKWSGSWVYGKDTIGAGKKGRKGEFRDQVRTGKIAKEYAPRIAALYPTKVRREVPPKVAIAKLPGTVEEIQEVVKGEAKREKMVELTEADPSVIDLTPFQLPPWANVKLRGGGTTPTAPPGTTRSLSKEELLNQVQNKAETETDTAQPKEPEPKTKTIVTSVTEEVPSDLKVGLDDLDAYVKAGAITQEKVFSEALVLAERAGVELKFEQYNPKKPTPYHYNVPSALVQKYAGDELTVAQSIGLSFVDNVEIAVHVPPEALTVKVTRAVTKVVPVDTPVLTVIGDDTPSVEPVTEEAVVTPGLTSVAEPPPPGPATTWKYTITDPNGDTVAHVEVQPDGSMNLEGGVIGQPVTTEPDGPQNVTIGGRTMSVTFDNGRAKSIKDAPQVSPETESETSETEEGEPADVPATENPVKKAGKAFVTTVKTIFNFIFGDREEGGEGREIFTQPGMGGIGTSTR